MLRKSVLFIICVFPLLSYAQDFSARWNGHFSYNDIKEVVYGSNKIYAAGSNAVFSLDTETNEILEFSSINGLSGETISTVYYSEVYELLVVGYENGLIEIVFDNDDDVLSIVDIIEKPTIPANNKRINHFNAFQNVVYVSTNYGISVFNLERLEFGDTFFIGSAGSQIQVNETTILGDYIYAACSGGNGIKKAEVSSPNLIDYQNWQQIAWGNFLFVETLEDKLYAVKTDKRIYSVINNVLKELFGYTDIPVDVKSGANNLIVTTKNNAFIYDTSFNLVSQVLVDDDFNTQYTSAIVDSDAIYIGTKNFGVLKTTLNNPVIFEEIHPDGPLLNNPFSIKVSLGGLWVTFGEYDEFLNPYPLNSRGFSHLKEEAWINTEYSDVLGARCLNNVVINPFNVNQVFISSFRDGLLEVNDEVPTVLYDENNSILDYMIYPNNPNLTDDVRVGGSMFDDSGVLWTLTSFVDEPLKSYKPDTNQWVSYSFTDVIPNGLGDLGFRDMDIDNSSGTKWVTSSNHGVIGFNENNGNPLIKALYKEEDNMPSVVVKAVALDKRGQLWIGTKKGLRVLYNASNFFTDANVEAQEIVILEDGIAKELLFQQFITDIKVDGSNNKWVGTADSGVFYFSSDGQKTLFHFTKDNSPLPSNVINDISLDASNGIVYIATTRGLVSFNSGGSSPLQDLDSAYAYPNPVRPTFNIVDEKVKIKDISENVNIKITDIEGNLVAEAQSNTNLRYYGYNLEIDGGTAYWNGKNLANTIVASGVYLVMLSDLDTFETKVLKLMVVR